MAFSGGYEDAQENVDSSVDCRGIYCTNSGREGKGAMELEDEAEIFLRVDG